MKEIPVSQIKGFKIGHAQDLEHATGCTLEREIRVVE